ncbi:MAG: hypothetical protein ACK5NK_02570 [Niabella sp.]
MENYNPQNYQSGQSIEKGVFNSLEVDQSSKANLAEAAKWAKFLGIVGIVMLVLMILGGLSIAVVGSSVLSNMEGYGGMPFSGAIFGGIYIVIALLYAYPTWALFKFGSLMRLAVQTEDQTTLNQSFGFLKKFFTFFGILTIIVIGIYILGIIGFAVGAGISGFN